MKPQGPKGYGVHHSLHAPRHLCTGACDGHRCIMSEAFDISSGWSTRQSLRFDDFPLTDLEDLPTHMKSMAFAPYYWMVCRASTIWKFRSHQP